MCTSANDAPFLADMKEETLLNILIIHCLSILPITRVTLAYTQTRMRCIYTGSQGETRVTDFAINKSLFVIIRCLCILQISRPKGGRRRTHKRGGIAVPGYSKGEIVCALITYSTFNRKRNEKKKQKRNECSTGEEAAKLLTT